MKRIRVLCDVLIGFKSVYVKFMASTVERYSEVIHRYHFLFQIQQMNRWNDKSVRIQVWIFDRKSPIPVYSSNSSKIIDNHQLAT